MLLVIIWQTIQHILERRAAHVIQDSQVSPSQGAVETQPIQQIDTLTGSDDERRVIQSGLKLQPSRRE
ncbi:hypothetical protein R1sor_010623 [Riccia sorocarpa]|uniref:Uncharacterized protein n=1 Tax=Riccia sorocarpa TaxID=122646 RepID=A0ABD3I1A7_9MARC